MNKRIYTGVVIAGGMSRRMGGFKPLLDVGGKPALLRLLDTIRAAGISRVIIVTGYGHERIEMALVEKKAASADDCAAQIELIYNEDYESGMFSSVRTGIRFAASCKGDALLFPVDVPLVEADTITGLIGAFETAGVVRRPFAVPVFKGKNGHPLLIPHEHFDEILVYGGDRGLKGIRSKYDPDMIRYETIDAGCVLDMDTPEDYARLLKYDEQRKTKFIQHIEHI